MIYKVTMTYKIAITYRIIVNEQNSKKITYQFQMKRFFKITTSLYSLYTITIINILTFSYLNEFDSYHIFTK